MKLQFKEQTLQVAFNVVPWIHQFLFILKQKAICVVDALSSEGNTQEKRFRLTCQFYIFTFRANDEWTWQNSNKNGVITGNGFMKN